MTRVKVWDLFVRTFHWGLVLLVLGSFLTGEKDALLGVHVGVGITVVGLVLARIVWGLVGPEQARFRAFVRGPREMLAYARALLERRPPPHLTHNPLGGAMVVALLCVLAGLAATGALVYAGPEFQGPLSGLLTKRGAHALKEVHEALSGALLGLVALHVIGIAASSLIEGQNLVAGMITGWKRAPDEAGRLAPAPRFAPVRVAGALRSARPRWWPWRSSSACRHARSPRVRWPPTCSANTRPRRAAPIRPSPGSPPRPVTRSTWPPSPWTARLPRAPVATRPTPAGPGARRPARWWSHSRRP